MLLSWNNRRTSSGFATGGGAASTVLMGTKMEASARRALDNFPTREQSARMMWNFSKFWSRHSMSIPWTSWATSFTLMISSPGMMAFSGHRLPRHCRLYASVALPRRMPSTRSARSLSACDDRLRPRSAPSAFRSVKLKVVWPSPWDPRGLVLATGVCASELKSDNGVRCGVCVPSTSDSSNGAVAEEGDAPGAATCHGCDGGFPGEKGNNGTSGSFVPVLVGSAPVPAAKAGPHSGANFAKESGGDRQGSLRLPTPSPPPPAGAGATATLASGRPLGRGPAAGPLPLKASPSIENRDAKFWMPCLSFSFSASSARCFSQHLPTSSPSLLSLSLCFVWSWVNICFPR
mmetsp:Transcript_16868/g.47989  ORF Transcript_16868/g.47989 Transcript_16868/m.47989 type:complete len:347 (+) Transcript_16868:238-1278(+)